MESIQSVATEKKFIAVEEAQDLILSTKHNFGVEIISITNAIGRILAEDITADRDLPPFDRATMDGIAINYEAFDKGIRRFRIKGTQAAGEDTIDVNSIDECIEIMTGAAAPASVDTIIRYEDILIENDEAFIQTATVKKGQNIHYKGSDKKKGEVLVRKDQTITPAILAAAASVGKTTLSVKQLPKCIVISTGDELVDIDQMPKPFQIRRSNSYCIEGVLKQYLIQPDSIHLPDDEPIITKEIKQALQNYDVLLLSGGISMGKFDHVAQAMAQASVKKIFYKVQQRPGKPFWFGCYQQKTIFAFPGNPVSAFLCLHRYFIPWLKNCLDVTAENYFAILDDDLEFNPPLTYFVQVKLKVDKEGKLLAKPIKTNGSGDFSSLVAADAFIELPPDKTFFKKGEVFKLWPVNNNFF